MYGAGKALCHWETMQRQMYKRVYPTLLPSGTFVSLSRGVCWQRLSSESGTMMTVGPVCFSQPVTKLCIRRGHFHPDRDFPYSSVDIIGFLCTSQLCKSFWCTPAVILHLLVSFQMCDICYELHIRVIVFKVKSYLCSCHRCWLCFFFLSKTNRIS